MTGRIRIRPDEESIELELNWELGGLEEREINRRVARALEQRDAARLHETTEGTT